MLNGGRLSFIETEQPDSAWLAAIPVLLALLVILVSPLLTRAVKTAIDQQISADMRTANLTEADIDRVPGFLSPKYVGDYVEYASDVVQIIPAMVLPIAGALISFSTSIPPLTSTLLLIFALLCIVILDKWALSMPTAKYVATGRFGYSPVTISAFGSNVIALVIIFLAS